MKNVKIFKKVFLLFVLVSFLILLFGGFCLAMRELEVVYPAVPGVSPPTTTKTALPEYFRYVFTLAVTIAGLVAFGALIYGGILYLTSAGDPSKMKNGQDQIMAGFFGLIIVLASFLILNTINPQLVILKEPPIMPGVGGIKIYTLANCQEDEKNPSFLVNTNIPNLIDPERLGWGLNGKKIHSIKFLGPAGSLTVTLYEGENYTGSVTEIKYPVGDPQPCKPVTPIKTYRSLSLDWHIPGVYLYTDAECKGKRYGIDYVIYQVSSATLLEFDDRTRSIKFVYGDLDKDLDRYQLRFAAILHDRENYMGGAKLYEQDQGRCEKVEGLSVSSITVYQKPRFIKVEGVVKEEIIGNGVRFYEDKNYSGCDLPRKDFYRDGAKEPNLYFIKKCGNYDVEKKECKGGYDCEDTISSIDIDGNYVALLFELPNYRGECEVFMSRDPDLRNNRIGQCGWHGRADCLSSFIIKARK